MLQTQDSMNTTHSENDDECHSKCNVTGETFTGLNRSVRKTKRNRHENGNIDDVTYGRLLFKGHQNSSIHLVLKKDMT